MGNIHSRSPDTFIYPWDTFIIDALLSDVFHKDDTIIPSKAN